MNAHYSILIAVLASGAAFAQSPQGSLKPVERHVEDIDLLQTSLRRVEPGLWHQGQDTRVYQTPSGKFVYMSGGIWAQFDQSKYVKTRKGKVLQGIPANTVFFIGRPSHLTTSSPSPQTTEPTLTQKRRVDGQVQNPVGQAVKGQWQPKSPPALQAGQRHHLRTPAPKSGQSSWQMYRQQRKQMVQALFAAIDQLDQSPVPQKTPAHKPPSPLKKSPPPNAVPPAQSK